MNHARALLLLAACALLWSMGGVLIKSVELHPLAIAGIRSAIAAVVLAIAARRLHFTWSRTQIVTAVCFAYTVISFVSATKLTTAANAILLQYTAPVYIILLSGPLLQERVTRRDVCALSAILLGMVVFFLEKLSTAHLVGDLIAISSGVSFAGLTIALRLHKGASTFPSLFLGHVLAALIGVPFLFASSAPTAHDWVFLTLLGVLQLGIPYVLYGIAIHYVSALEGALIPMLEPVFNPIWVALFLGELPSTYALAGGAIVILTVIWHSVPSLVPSPD
jgi:drug/metabolite transporter (DMT)-like permease